MSIYVVDASVAAKWFFDEIHSQEALSLLDEHNQLHAPDLLLLEIDSIVCRKIRRGEVSVEEGREVRSALGLFPIRKHPFSVLADAAFEMACKLSASPYDSMYLILAILLHGRLVTADRHFYNSVSAQDLSEHLCWVEDL